MNEPNQKQVWVSYMTCYWLTKMYLPIYLVTFDQRYNNVIVIAGEESVITINTKGELSYER